MNYPSVETILPHKEPMVLLDRVEDDATGSITCRVAIRSNSPFAENGSVPAVVATEYMAQCVAAYAGLKAHRRGEPIRIGYLIGARGVAFRVDAFTAPQELTVRARRIWGDDTLGQFRCCVETDRGEDASALLTVFQGSLDAMESVAR